MTRRWVVLEHRRGSEVHYDLMVEDGEALVTWQLPSPPAPGVRGVRSFDHRRRYLDYEGPIGGDRGEVRRWDAGSLDDWVGSPRAARYAARFRGARLRATLELREDERGVLVRLVEAGA
ncbi:MAG: hypothetical protein D6731_17955 [Planctomycetota bacterium]|nr:MAG: hypothetical protein D6731_17955 [Planctomycetota bacterium]